jgi:hypothetical protein
MERASEIWPAFVFSFDQGEGVFAENLCALFD